MGRLYIAEKPKVAAAIAQSLAGKSKPVRNQAGGYYTVGNDKITWAFGHMLELAEPHLYDEKYKKWSFNNLPIIPKDWKLIAKKESKQQLDNIVALMKSATEIVHAGDPDREGQLLIDELLEKYKFKGNVLRYWSSALDAASVGKALSKLQNNKDKQFSRLKDSALGRSLSDWLVGINLTRGMSVRAQQLGYGAGQPPISIGRVQTPVLALVVQREEEINNFKAVDFFTVSATVAVGKGEFVGKYKTVSNTPGVDNDGRLIDEKVAKAIVDRVKGTTGEISLYETKRESEKPPITFSLQDIQIAASKKLGVSTDEVLNICQSLYEKHELTSYPRVDTGYLPKTQFADAPGILKSISGVFPRALKANPTIQSPAWNDSEVTAHHGIIPTSKVPNLAALTSNERFVYEMICNQYIAQFYPNYISDKTNIEATYTSANAKDVFAASGRVDVSLGWREVIQPKKKGAEDDLATIPQSALKEKATATNCSLEAKKTKPPARFTESSLLHAMNNIHLHVKNPEIKAKLKETDGLGTPATQSSIIKTIVSRKTVEVKSGKFYPTAMGISVIKAAPPLLRDPGMTAIWESALKKINEGTLDVNEFLTMQEKSLINMVAYTSTVHIDIPEESKKSVGKFSGGSNSKYPSNTKWTKPAGATASAAKTPSPIGQFGVCPGCGKAIVTRVAKNGSSAGYSFLACSGFPACKQKIDQSPLTKQTSKGSSSFSDQKKRSIGGT